MANTKITTNVIADDAITTAKIADDAVGNDQLASGLTLGGNTAATLSTAAQPNITSLGTLSALTISGDLTVDTSTLKVDSTNNRVGIQETSPDYNLHISNASQVGLRIDGSGSGYVQGSILLSSATSGSNAYRGHGIFYWNNESQTEWFLGAPYTDSDRFVINRKASQSSADFSSAYIHASHGQNFLTIENDGKVGIGKTVPGSQLEIYNAAAGATPMLKTMSHATAAGSFTNDYSVEFRHATSTVTHGMLVTNVEADDSRRTLDVADSNGVFASFVNGKVGIGTTTPGALLHVKHAGGGFDEVARLTSVANSAGDGAFLGFHGNSTSKFYGFIGGYDINTNQGGVKIGVGNGETAIADSMTKMTIDNTGITTFKPGLGDLSIKNNDGSGQKGIILEANDANHAIYFRRGRDGTLNTMDFHEYDQFRFYTGGAIASQTERMRILSDGEVVMAGDSNNFSNNDAKVCTMYCNSASNWALSVINDHASGYGMAVRADSGNQVFFYIGGVHSGSIVSSGTSTAYGNGSDYRLKENVSDLTGGIDRLKLLKPKRFNYITDETNTLRDGFIAHEAQTVIPEAVTGQKDDPIDDKGIGYQQLDYGQITPLLTAALQEAIAKIETLETKVKALEEKLNG